MPPKPPPDWVAIERDYCAGILPLRAIANAHGTTHTSIRKRAARDGWVRNLTDKIQARAAELVSKQAVSNEVSKQRLATERQVIEANAERIAQVLGEHRGDISGARSLTLTLLAQLQQQTQNPELFERAIAALSEPEDGENPEDAAARRKRLNELLRNALALGQRSTTLKSLVESLRTVIGLEREAYGVDDEKPQQPLSQEQMKREIIRLLNAGGADIPMGLLGGSGGGP